MPSLLELSHTHFSPCPNASMNPKYVGVHCVISIRYIGLEAFCVGSVPNAWCLKRRWRDRRCLVMCGSELFGCGKRVVWTLELLSASSVIFYSVLEIFCNSCLWVLWISSSCLRSICRFLESWSVPEDVSITRPKISFIWIQSPSSTLDFSNTDRVLWSNLNQRVCLFDCTKYQLCYLILLGCPPLLTITTVPIICWGNKIIHLFFIS